MIASKIFLKSDNLKSVARTVIFRLESAKQHHNHSSLLLGRDEKIIFIRSDRKQGLPPHRFLKENWILPSSLSFCLNFDFGLIVLSLARYLVV